jgi:hypothetical protein
MLPNLETNSSAYIHISCDHVKFRENPHFSCHVQKHTQKISKRLILARIFLHRPNKNSVVLDATSLSM